MRPMICLLIFEVSSDHLIAIGYTSGAWISVNVKPTYDGNKQKIKKQSPHNSRVTKAPFCKFLALNV